MFTKYKVFIFSETPDELVKFYRDCLGFPVISELKLPLDYGYMVEVAPGYEIWIAEHSEVKDTNKDTYRYIINIYTDGVRKIFEKANQYPGVKVVEAPTSMKKFNPASDRLFFTILDPEGNCLQFMEPK